MVHEMNRMGCRHVFADYHYRTLLIYATDEKWNIKGTTTNNGRRFSKVPGCLGRPQCSLLKYAFNLSTKQWWLHFYFCRCISNCRDSAPHWMHSSLSDEGETKDLQNKHLTRSSVEFFTQPEFNVFHNCLQHAYHHPRAPGNFGDERKSLF